MKETKNVISRNGKNQWTTNRKKNGQSKTKSILLKFINKQTKIKSKLNFSKCKTKPKQSKACLS